MPAKKFTTTSGIEIKSLLPKPSAMNGVAGQFPFTRGIRGYVPRLEAGPCVNTPGFNCGGRSDKRYHIYWARGRWAFRSLLTCLHKLVMTPTARLAEGWSWPSRCCDRLILECEFCLTALKLKKHYYLHDHQCYRTYYWPCIALAKKTGADLKQFIRA